MTKEPIMIDDVDVSGCIYYADGKCTNSQMIQSNCKNVAVCYFKEYKRKEQECEKVKKQFRCSSCGTCRGKEDYNNMSRHFDKLRESFDFTFNTLEKVLEAEVYLYKTYIDKTFTGNFDWENDKVSIHLEKFIKDSIEHIKFIDETNKILYQEKCELIELNKQYKQALQEIKEIITNSFDSCYVCNSKYSCEKCLQGEILQKCEVIDD